MTMLAPDVRQLTASLVVRPGDVWGAAGRPREPLDVTLANRAVTPVRTAGGAWVFTDLPSGTLGAPLMYDVAISGPCYLPVQQSVPVPDPLSGWPQNLQVVELALRPSLRYPFAPNLTLLRGRVVRGGQPLAGALVAVGAQTFPTGPTGEFVFPFDAPDSDPRNVAVAVSGLGAPPAATIVALARYRTTSAEIDYP